MLTASFCFAILCFALLLVFFSGVPNLKTCSLPEAFGINGSDYQCRLAVMLVTLLYACCAFWNLGNFHSPQTFIPVEGKSVIFELPAQKDTTSQTETAVPVIPKQLVLFPGVGQGSYSIEYSNDMEGWFPLTEFSQDHVTVLKWQYIPLSLPVPARFLRIHCTSGTPWLGEAQLQDASGLPIAATISAPQLNDEQSCVPGASDYHNSSYFDEIYHARTAWEHLHGIWPYEISHPPLGKEILSLGILLFGMTPFGWRFSGTLTGIMMLPLMYHFLKRLFGQGRIPVLGTILFAADFMHYVQTRIATIDSYAVFFILLMYDFMLGWLQTGRRRDLALCGISFGLGAACKWTCLYAGAGLALLWGGHWILSFRSASRPYDTCPEPCLLIEEAEPVLSKALEKRNSSLKRHSDRYYGLPLGEFFNNALLCIVFFVLVPGLIYYLSYLPYGLSQNAPIFSRAYTKLVIDNQSFMFHYHANVQAEHPYSSRWYQWILNIRPILYYLEYLPNGGRISIAAFLNPLICWGGFLALPVLGYTALVRRNRTAAFLLVGYASGLVPWMFISRLTFEYHYFASAAFLIPVLCYVFFLIEEGSGNRRVYTTGFTLLAVLLFILFFPVLNGLPVPNDLASRILGWLPTWPI